MDKTYIATLSHAKRATQRSFVSTGKGAARRLIHGRVLDLAICEAVAVSRATGERIRKWFVEQGLDLSANIAIALISSVLGLVFLVAGVRTYLICTPEARRRFLGAYAALPDCPKWQRNAQFVFIPAGLWFIWGSIYLLGLLPSLHVALAVVELAALVGWIVLLDHLPAWLKPNWIREQERAGFPLLHQPER